MNNFSCVIISVFLLLLTGCNKQKTISEKLLDEVEKSIEINPDSAQELLDSIPENMENKSFARRCMLSGKITDKIYNTLLPAEQYERAYDWYSTHGNPSEQVQILIYMGRSYATDGDYDKAMAIYTDALDLAKENDLNKLTGYIYCYMGDLYQMRAIMTRAINKYKIAAKCFKESENLDSYACALRDVGRSYARMDSIESAFDILFIADSIAVNLDNKEIKASIDNTLGNVYLIKGEYEKAKTYFKEALKSGRNKLPNYVALIELYIHTDSIAKAKDLLNRIPKDNPKYTYSRKELSYQIYKSEMNYEKALVSLEECADMIDSILNTTNKSKILNIETRYNNLKIKEKVRILQIKQQNFTLVLTICLSVILLGILGYLLYRKKVEEKIRSQQLELNKIKIDFLNLSIELEQKKKLSASMKENDKKYNRMKDEIEVLSNKYKKLQTRLISESPVYKELKRLIDLNIPRNNKSLITENLWSLIRNEVMSVYPNLFGYINSLCPNLSEQEVDYCCFCMYGFDSNAEAKLLNISPSSVRTKRLRLRQRLNISLPAQTTLYEYLIEKLN